MDRHPEIDVQVVKHAKEARRDPFDRPHLDAHRVAFPMTTRSSAPAEIDQGVTEQAQIRTVPDLLGPQVQDRESTIVVNINPWRVLPARLDARTDRIGVC